MYLNVSILYVMFLCECVCHLHLPLAVISDLYNFDIFGPDLSH